MGFCAEAWRCGATSETSLETMAPSVQTKLLLGNVACVVVLVKSDVAVDLSIRGLSRHNFNRACFQFYDLKRLVSKSPHDKRAAHESPYSCANALSVAVQWAKTVTALNRKPIILPLNLLSLRLDGVTAFNPISPRKFDLVHAFNRIPVARTPFVICFESHLPRAFCVENGLCQHKPIKPRHSTLRLR
jgi:hypothetical protein